MDNNHFTYFKQKLSEANMTKEEAIEVIRKNMAVYHYISLELYSQEKVFEIACYYGLTDQLLKKIK